MKTYVITSEEFIKGDYKNKPLYIFFSASSFAKREDMQAELNICKKYGHASFSTKKANLIIYENEIVIAALDEKTKIQMIEYLLT